MPTQSPVQAELMKSDSFDIQYERILDVTCARSQTQLAKDLGVKQSSISDAKRRTTIPSRWLIKLFDQKRVNPDYVRFGHLPKILLEDSSLSVPIRSLEAVPIDQLFRAILLKFVPEDLAAVTQRTLLFDENLWKEALANNLPAMLPGSLAQEIILHFKKEQETKKS